MRGRIRTIAAAAAVAVAVAVVLAPAVAFGQQSGGTTGAATVGTSTTGPNAPLTLGTPTDTSFSSGGSSDSFVDEPLAETGGGELALGAGAAMMAAGAGMHLLGARRRR